VLEAEAVDIEALAQTLQEITVAMEEMVVAEAEPQPRPGPRALAVMA
jgi:hypothetical protein